jgi:hypothetical protein
MNVNDGSRSYRRALPSFSFTMCIGTFCELFVLVVCMPCAVSVAEESRSVQRVAFQTFKSIASSSCEGSRFNSLGLVSKFRYLKADGKYRVYREDSSSPVINGRTYSLQKGTWAYDSNRYQSLDDTGYLKLSDHMQGVGHTDPLLVAFAWLPNCQCIPSTHDNLMNESNWESQFLLCVSKGNSSFKGFNTLLLEFEQTCATTMCKFQVHFAVDLGFFPIKYERFVGSTGELTTVFEVQEIRTQKSATGIVAYPIKLFRKELGADGASLPMEETIHVDESTLLLNQPVDQQLFTLDESKVNFVHDVDKIRKASNLDENKPAPKSTFSSRSLFVIANILACGFLLYLLWGRRIGRHA